MTENIKKRRPQFRNIQIFQILQYRLPIAGFMSILHRVSGAGMFLALPLIVWLFDMSITSELSYAQLLELTDTIAVKLLLCGLSLAFIHHFMGGIRHLINDMHIGISKEASPLMAKGFLAASLVVSSVAWAAIFGVLS